MKKLMIVIIFLVFGYAYPETTGGHLIGGNFKLHDLKGKVVRGKDFTGKYLLVFFGFTSCPTVCPLGTKTMMSVYKSLKNIKNETVPVFITIDPEVDTPKRLKKFKERFGKQLVTLRGNKKETDDVVKMYRGYYSKKTRVNIDHSDIIYFMGKDGKYLSHFPSNLGASKIKEKIDAILAEINTGNQFE
ncbi:MAG: SCO family protein [Halobacteriovoraceae bacterium]|nr:SCO family protein [Halobacteriovoraceae bacterium]MCB9095818.1 SCO family protein [Halobacteriovoraceae bacterium]